MRKAALLLMVGAAASEEKVLPGAQPVSARAKSPGSRCYGRKRDEVYSALQKDRPKGLRDAHSGPGAPSDLLRYPQEHWIHLRATINIVESPFNTVRLRTDASRRFKKVKNTEAIESGSCSWSPRNPGARSTHSL